MPLRDHDLREVRSRVLRMFMDTITTFEMIEKNADQIYGDKAPDVRAAINIDRRIHLTPSCQIELTP